MDDIRDVRDTAAPDSNRHAGAQPKPRGKAGTLELLTRFPTDIGETQIGRILPDEEHPGGKHQAKVTR
jgi:hypothetical protein